MTELMRFDFIDLCEEVDDCEIPYIHYFTFMYEKEDEDFAELVMEYNLN